MAPSSSALLQALNCFFTNHDLTLSDSKLFCMFVNIQ